MPAVEEISESLIRENITRAVADVFKTMLGRPIAPGAPEPGEVRDAPGTSAAQVVGTVGFIGEVNGLVYLYLDESFANQCTGEILGMSALALEAAGDEVVNDAIGELTNMVVGSFKNALCDAGYPCKLTIPSILRGRNFCIQSTRMAERRSYRFTCGGHRVVTDIIIKAGD
jgi:chemotaxis protein CheX